MYGLDRILDIILDKIKDKYVKAIQNYIQRG